MTDGPFRNAQLSGRWKRYGRDLVSDATSLEERTAQACHSMLGDISSKEFASLLGGLASQAQRSQLDLDPVTLTDAIFDRHSKTPLADALQKHLTAQLRNQVPQQEALERALTSTTTDWVALTKNRLDEECIRARDAGDMTRQQYGKGIERNRQTFDAVDIKSIRDALISGKASVFKKAVKKKSGVDEGPD